MKAYPFHSGSLLRVPQVMLLIIRLMTRATGSLRCYPKHTYRGGRRFKGRKELNATEQFPNCLVVSRLHPGKWSERGISVKRICGKTWRKMEVKTLEKNGTCTNFWFRVSFSTSMTWSAAPEGAQFASHQVGMNIPPRQLKSVIHLACHCPSGF